MELNGSSNEQHSFANPDTIRILGTRQPDASHIREADILFDDRQGNHWYLTVVTGTQYIADTINTWRESEETQEPTMQLGSNATQEPPKFVWNGGDLDDEGVINLVRNAPLELLEPFIIDIPEEDLEDFTKNKN